MRRLHTLVPHPTVSEPVRRLAFRTFLMLFSWIWVLQILIPLGAIWRDEPSWSTRIGVTVLASAFIAMYSYVIFRIYFHRRSWSFIFTATERWMLRAIIGGIGVTLVFWQGNDWALTLIFVVITAVITAPPRQAFMVMIPAMIAVAAVLLIAPVTPSMRVSVLAISFVLGILTASQMLQGDEMGELIAARYREARIAAADERLRIARDLHDVLGHTLSLITLKSELASRLVDADPGRAQQEIREVERIARSAMAEVRRTVAGEHQPVLTSELDAARQLLAAADIEVRIESDERPLPTQIASLVAWGVREGVTNVVRHSRARRCTIRLQSGDDEAQLTILDDGTISSSPGLGMGLPGLRRRAEDVGGSVSFEAMPDRPGHRLWLRVPIPTVGETG